MSKEQQDVVPSVAQNCRAKHTKAKNQNMLQQRIVSNEKKLSAKATINRENRWYRAKEMAFSSQQPSFRGTLENQFFQSSHRHLLKQMNEIKCSSKIDGQVMQHSHTITLMLYFIYFPCVPHAYHVAQY